MKNAKRWNGIQVTVVHRGVRYPCHDMSDAMRFLHNTPLERFALAVFEVVSAVDNGIAVMAKEIRKL